MRKDDMILVSVDDQLIEPGHRLDGFLPARLADRAAEEYGPQPPSIPDQHRPDRVDVHERVRELNADGVLASLTLPASARFSGPALTNQARHDPELALAVVRAYNDWQLDAWCGTYPDRFIPCAITPWWDPVRMAEEVRRTAANGAHAVSFTGDRGLGLPSLRGTHWDAFFAACAETATVVCVHIGSDAEVFGAAAELVSAPVFRKFPELRVLVSGGGIGWLPYFLERADRAYFGQRAGVDLGGWLPSEVYTEHVTTSFTVDEFGLDNLYRLAEDMVAWAGDFPRAGSTWPRSPESLAAQTAGLTAARIDKITHRNALRLFSFDPFAVRSRQQCTVGALRRAVDGQDVRPGEAPHAELVTG